MTKQEFPQGLEKVWLNRELKREGTFHMEDNQPPKLCGSIDNLLDFYLQDRKEDFPNLGNATVVRVNIPAFKDYWMGKMDKPFSVTFSKSEYEEVDSQEDDENGEMNKRTEYRVFIGETVNFLQLFKGQNEGKIMPINGSGDGREALISDLEKYRGILDYIGAHKEEFSQEISLQKAPLPLKVNNLFY